MQFTRRQVIERIRAKIAAGRPVITAGAGIGISAKFAERGGADLIVVYNSGRYRMTGYTSVSGFLPIGDANAIVLEMGEREILPAARKTPIVAGIFAADPTRDMMHLLRRVRDIGFSGIINFPTVAYLEGELRSALESSGLGFECEVRAVTAAASVDLYTMAYVFTADEAAQMATAGVDCLVAHMGNTAGGTVGQKSVLALTEAARRTQEIVESARKRNADAVVLCHGGPIATPTDVTFMLEHTDVEGFVGASSMERLPVEKPLEDMTRAFTNLTLRKVQ
jgi:predicted TIM-barrel enzyme